MREEDLRVRNQLMEAGELGGPYVPRMEAVHVRNAARLRELIAVHGWPAEDIAGEDGAKAAWFIVQHSVGEPPRGATGVGANAIPARRSRRVARSGWITA